MSKSQKREKKRYENNIINPRLLTIIFFISSMILFVTTVIKIFGKKPGQEIAPVIVNNQITGQSCYDPQTVNKKSNPIIDERGEVQSGQSDCFVFSGKAGQTLEIDTDIQFILLKPNNGYKNGQGFYKENLADSGEYRIRVNGYGGNSKKSYQLKVYLTEKNFVQISKPNVSQILQSPPSLVPGYSMPLTYNVRVNPYLKLDNKLESIVNESINIIKDRGLSVDKLSISLFDLTRSARCNHRCTSYAGYQHKVPRFPASVSKLFWMVALFGYYQKGEIPEGSVTNQELDKMIQDSDNNSASHILDKLTKTESGDEMAPSELKIWIEKRERVNNYFKYAGYELIDISQKNFPIPDLNLKEPQGRELQMRRGLSSPRRNYLTTHETARLLLEIDQGQAISSSDSEEMKRLLKRNYEKEKRKEYNSIKGFFGQDFARQDIRIFSKVGWTTSSRQEAAIIESPDRKARYILVIFGDDPSFANDWKIFPEVSQLIYKRMTD